METERLYYNDPYLLEFDANIIETRPVGKRVGIILDKTAFYPTSGGQPNDLGTINGLPLVDCLEDEASGNRDMRIPCHRCRRRTFHIPIARITIHEINHPCWAT